jgi:DNA-binding transcriptional MerR regulator/methylmalonyl-CoA mutase cobalamin-binding subunit
MSVDPKRPNAPRLRIGELSRRTGVAPDTLRAWERRYGLLRPDRSEGGFRLYGLADERRVQAMKTLIDSGVSAAESARLATSGVPEVASPTAAGEASLESGASRLREALEQFDEAAAHTILDAALTRLTVDRVADQVVLPAIREIGRRWESGEISVAQEHFATGLLRERMLALGRNWGAGVGPRALLACPPGERHDLGLVAFGVVLRDRGWRVTYLGPDTPIETIARTATDLRPAAIVLVALDAERFEAVADRIAALAREAPVLIGGEGADPELARRLGAEALHPDPVRAALRLASPPSPGDAAQA